jgi:hypothetical protein
MQDIMSAMPMTEGREFITLNGARVAARGPSSRWYGVFRAFHFCRAKIENGPANARTGRYFDYHSRGHAPRRRGASVSPTRLAYADPVSRTYNGILEMICNIGLPFPKAHCDLGGRMFLRSASECFFYVLRRSTRPIFLDAGATNLD